jgi:hypothetical protein
LQLRKEDTKAPDKKVRVVRSAETDSKLVSFLADCADLTIPTCPLLVDIARLIGYDKEDTDALITSWRDFSKADGMFPGFHDMPDWSTLSAEDKVLIRIHKLDDFREYLNKDL